MASLCYFGAAIAYAAGFHVLGTVVMAVATIDITTDLMADILHARDMRRIAVCRIRRQQENN